MAKKYLNTYMALYYNCIKQEDIDEDWLISEDKLLDELKLWIDSLHGLGTIHMKISFYEVYEETTRLGKMLDTEGIGWLELYYNHHTGIEALFAYTEYDTGSNGKKASMHITYENHHLIYKITKIMPKGVALKIVSMNDKEVKW